MEKESGVFIGVNKTYEKPVLFNPFECNSYQNRPVFGEPGVGKQFKMKEILSVQENKALCGQNLVNRSKSIGGVTIRLDTASASSINVFDIIKDTEET
jgi:hypothetical protein